MIFFFREGAIFASSISKKGNRCPLIEGDDLRSSTESFISHFLDPMHCFRRVTRTGTYLGFEARLPALKCRRIRVSVEMHFQDVIPRLFNHTILRISSFCMRRRIPCWKLTCKSRCKYCKVLNVSFSFLHMCNRSFCLDAVGASGAGGFAKKKRFPMYQTSSVCQAASKNRG